MALNVGIFITLLVVTTVSMVSSSCGAAIRDRREASGSRTTNINIRLLSAGQVPVGYDRTTTCVANYGDFVVQGLDQNTNSFCILLYKKASDCLDNKQHDFKIYHGNLTEFRNLPSVQAIKQCLGDERMD